MNSPTLSYNLSGVAIFIYLLNFMNQFDLASLRATPLFADYNANNFLTKVLTFVIVMILLKRYFRGGQFTLPEVDLEGKYAVVTGGNSGIGAETVKVLCRLGCSVVIGARNKQTAEELMKQVKRKNYKAHVEYIELDLSSRASIQSFAKAISFPKIDYLVNNAGLFKIPKRRLTKEGAQMQWGVNHLGHFYLTYLLWNKITSSSFFRIVNVSSVGHKQMFGVGPQPTVDWENINLQKGYNPHISYSRSKLYNVLFTKALAEKVGTRGKVTTLHPGVCRTEVAREITSDGIKGKLTKLFIFILYPLIWLITKNAQEGCQTTLYCLLSEDAQNGQYYADCKPSEVNKNVTRENQQKLWQISEKWLGIKFEV